MKLTIKLFILLTLFTCTATAVEKDEITFEWLIETAKKTAYTDHIPHFRRLFNLMKVRGFIECGCGFSSKYFLDHSDMVTSIEFIDLGSSDMWYKECLKIFKDCPQWKPLLFNADRQNDSFNKACAYQCAKHKNYWLIDSKYLFDLENYFKGQMEEMKKKGCPVDVAFVDPGVYVRGDMVNLFLGLHVPVVVAHDTMSDEGSEIDEGLYGWFKVKTPLEYHKILIPFGTGTTFWVQKRFPKIIQSIQKYRDKLVELQANGTLIYCQNAEQMAQLADDL